MKTFLKQSLLGAAVLAAAVTRASAISSPTLSYGWTGSQSIPDNNASGIAFAFSLSAPYPVIITNVTVDLTIAGGWDGDLYAYLSHGSGFSVLLNRVGSTTANPGGSGASGMSVEFSDSYATDIHTGAGNPLTGNFAPDGRFVNPYFALDTDPRTAMLGSFNNLDPNGAWTLFLADVSPLGVSTVQSWTVNVSTTVPEPGIVALLLFAFFAVVSARNLTPPAVARASMSTRKPNPRK
jgi:subtilisin-like proprotein convertase family protein